MSQVAASTVRDGGLRAARPTAAPAQPVSEADELEVVGVRDSLISYDAIAVYFSFVFHLAALGVTLLVLFLLNLWYMPKPYELQDPIRAALSDSTILDEEPLLEAMPLEVMEAEAVDAPDQLETELIDDELSLDVAAVVDATSASGSEAKGTEGASMFLPKGANAVQKGSFTAWTQVPDGRGAQAPREGQRYVIIIEIQLPPEVKSYRLRDLKGMVVGTDKYKQTIPGETTTVRVGDRVMNIDKNKRIPVQGNKVQIIVRVPGARRGVVDDVSIRSRLLREEQEIKLKFADPDGNVAPDINPNELNGK